MPCEAFLMESTKKAIGLTRKDLVVRTRQGLSASPALCCFSGLPGHEQRHWIEHRDSSERTLLRNEWSKAARDYSDEPPLNWTSHSHGIQLEGSARGRLANLRSLSSTDEIEIPGPAAPVWRDQLISLLSPIGISVFERMRLLEHDDRQVSPPTR